MVVLGLAVFGLVVEPIIAWGLAVAIGPDQRDQIDPPDDRLVLARPVAADQFDLRGIGLVQGRVIQDQDTALAVDQRSSLLPQGLRVGLDPVQQSSEGVVGRGLTRVGLHGGGLRTRDGLGAGDQEVDVVGVVAFCGPHRRIIVGGTDARIMDDRSLIA